MKTNIQTSVIKSSVPVDLPAQQNPPARTGPYSPNPFSLDMRSITPVDLNADGFFDIFIHPSYYQTGPVLAPVVLLNDTKGGFYDGTSTIFKIAPEIHQSNFVAFEDFDRNGRVDLFIVDQGLETADPVSGGFPGARNHLYLQDSSGVFQDATQNIQGNSPSFNHISTLVDINNDGNLDVLVSRLGGPKFEGSGIFFYLGDGKGGFSFSTAGLPIEIRYKLNPEIQWTSKSIDYQFIGSAGAADLDNDGIQDIVTGSYGAPDHIGRQRTVRVFKQGTDGNFAQEWVGTAPNALLNANPTFGVAGITPADLDNDGLTDLIVRWEDLAYSGVQILKNVGDFQFVDTTQKWMGGYLLSGGGSSFMGSLAIDARDTNNDGNLDLVLNTMNSTAEQATGRSVNGTFLYLNDGTGHFTPAELAISGATVTGQQLTQIAGTTNPVLGIPLVFDANRDGKSDYVFIDAMSTADQSVFPYRPTSLTLITILGDDTRNIYRASDTGSHLSGSAIKDAFYGGLGADVFDGGQGIDTAVYSESKAKYTVNKTADKTYVGNAAVPNSIDTLVNVERVKFADVHLAFDISGNAGQAYRLYQAALNRTPDLIGLGAQIGGLDNGMSLLQIAQNFMDSAEFKLKYGENLSNYDFVKQLYSNVLHRAPDEKGLADQVHALEVGFTRSQLLVNFSESPENQAALIGVIQNGIEYMAA